jgi:hypothetical protein
VQSINTLATLISVSTPKLLEMMIQNSKNMSVLEMICNQLLNMENDDPEDATSSASPCILRNPNSYDVFLSHRGPDVNLTRDRDATSFASSSTSPSHGNPFASSSTSPSHGNPNSYVYDVFLNHRGPDVKTTLASHLYYRLEEHGLRAFFDKQELRAWERR